MLLLVILFPLIGAIVAGLFSFVIGRKGAAFLTTALMFSNVCLTFYIFYKISLIFNYQVYNFVICKNILQCRQQNH